MIIPGALPRFSRRGASNCQSVLDRMHTGSVADWDVFGSMVFWRAHPGFIFISNNLVYSSAYPGGTLAFPIDIPRVYFDDYSYRDLGMAWKNVASYFHLVSSVRVTARD
jgi:hypothetical protein